MTEVRVPIDSIRSFESTLRKANVPGRELPILTRRASEANAITSAITTLELPSNIDQRLIPHEADQPLFLTPYDEYEGMKVAIPSEEAREGWRRAHEYGLELANHPARIAAMRAVESKGFVKPQKIDQSVISAALALYSRLTTEGGMGYFRRTILQLSDLGHNIDISSFLKNPFNWEEMNNEQKREFVERVKAKKQIHRTPQLATGVFSMIGRQARSYIGGGAMPDTNGSVLALTTAAKLHMAIGVPEVGEFSHPRRQAKLAKATMDALTIDDPLLRNRSPEEAQYILNHWRRNIVGVIEVSKQKALERADMLHDSGVTTFRVYGHTQGGDLVETVESMRNRFPDSEIIASQVIDPETAFACEYVGADAIITGVGSGGRCTTADRAQSVPASAGFVSICRELGLNIPIIGEGGAVDDPIVAAIVGMSGVNASGSFLGGTFEAPGGMYFLQKDGQYYKPYGGEASPRTKWRSERVYPTGLPYFREGEETFKMLNQIYGLSAVQKLMDLQEAWVLGSVMLRINGGPDTLNAMHHLDGTVLFEKSDTTQYIQRTH